MESSLSKPFSTPCNKSISSILLVKEFNESSARAFFSSWYPSGTNPSCLKQSIWSSSEPSRDVVSPQILNDFLMVSFGIASHAVTIHSRYSDTRQLANRI